MLGRKKTSPLTESDIDVAPSIEESDAAPGRPAKKGRPTPTRRESEASRRKPLVPADRQAAKKADKEAARAKRVQQREALARGDESALPPRDRGPIKKYLRNTVDSRLSIGEILLPLMLVMLVLMFIRLPALQMLALFGVWIIVLLGILDAVLLWRRTKREVVAKFGQEPPKGSASYLVMRAFQMRMSRLPKATVKRGDKSWKSA
ncbi:DUF3043 domain-containing protein [Dermacoccaceae bacterium W4C1]